MAIPFNTMPLRGLRRQYPLTLAEEWTIRESLRRGSAMPDWVTDDEEDLLVPENYWDAMLGGTLT
jgi:hypothetical protein